MNPYVALQGAVGLLLVFHLLSWVKAQSLWGVVHGLFLIAVAIFAVEFPSLTEETRSVVLFVTASVGTMSLSFVWRAIGASEGQEDFAKKIGG